MCHIILQFQNTKYSQILYLIDYVDYGLYLCRNSHIKHNVPRTCLPTSWYRPNSALSGYVEVSQIDSQKLHGLYGSWEPLDACEILILVC